MLFKRDMVRVTAAFWEQNAAVTRTKLRAYQAYNYCTGNLKKRWNSKMQRISCHYVSPSSNGPFFFLLIDTEWNLQGPKFPPGTSGRSNATACLDLVPLRRHMQTTMGLGASYLLQLERFKRLR